MDIKDVPKVDFRPTGYRQLGEFTGTQTEAAALFQYYGARVWVPKSRLRFDGSHYCAPGWAIDSSKQFQRERARG